VRLVPGCRDELRVDSGPELPVARWVQVVGRLGFPPLGLLVPDSVDRTLP
jgi:hypothetical protein